VKRRTKKGTDAIKTTSVCPTCMKTIPATLAKKGEKVIMGKKCKEHGKFKEVVYNSNRFDEDLKYLKYVKNGKKRTDFSCDGCPKHITETCLAIIDVTNRCNLRCSYCFANAAVSKRLYEPDLKTMKEIIDFLRKSQPRNNAILFSGGEPTLREDFPDILRYARDVGKFECLMVATNGYRIANDVKYLKKMQDSGLGIIYLSFDGLTDETNKEKKNHNIVDKIMKNCRKCGVAIVLVPAIIKGVNNHEIWDIVKFGAKNNDVVKCINFQPIGFIGRMDPKEREKMRYNIPDLINDIDKQSNGNLTKDDFYPITAGIPFELALEKITKKEIIRFSMHPMCGSATYVYIDNDKITPLSEIMNVKKFIKLCDGYKKESEEKDFIKRKTSKLRFIAELKDVFKDEKILKTLILNLILNVDFNSLAELHQHLLFISAMHFMDPYNFDFERLKRCGVHYITPDKKTIPFCAYNNMYREKIEKKFSMRFEKGYIKPMGPGL